MTDIDLMQQLQYRLLEVPDGGVSWPSGLWTRDEIISDLTQRQAKLLKNALLLITPSNPDSLVGAASTRVALPADLVRIVSVVFNDSVTGISRELLRSDSYEADHLIPSWDQTPAAYPLIYMEYETPTLFVQIAPSPINQGTLSLLYVPKGLPFTGNGVPESIPDEFGHALVYGVLADVLGKDGRGRDVARAQYADQRFNLAVDLARIILKGWA